MPNDFLESDLEDILYENRNIIHTKGLPPFKSVVYRQVYLPSGRIIDILGFEVIDGKLLMDIYELKKECIDAAAVCQAYNYLEEIRQLIGGCFKEQSIKVFLIGRRTSMTSHIENTCLPIEVWKYDYGLSGIVFNKLNQSSLRHLESNSFKRGLVAFGTKKFFFQNDIDNISIHYEYDKAALTYPDTATSVINLIAGWETSNVITEVKKEIVKVMVHPPTVKTEHFPLNPSWSKEFEKEIWQEETEYMDELEVYEDEDLEDEYLEVDYDGEESEQPSSHNTEQQAIIIEMGYDIDLKYNINGR